MEKKKKVKTKILKKSELYRLIQELFTQNPKRTFNYKQVSGLIGAKKKTARHLVVVVLYELLESGFLNEVAKGKFKLLSVRSEVTGVVDMTTSGAAYIVPDEGDEDVFVARQDLNQALNGDRVKVLLFAHKRRRRPEGEVVEIVKRKRDTFVGTLEIAKNFAFLVTDNRVMHHDIFIPKDRIKGGRDGQKAIARIVEWPSKAKNPIGEIVDVLGDVGDANAEMHAILAEFNLPYKYPENVVEAAESISAEIPAEEIKKRRDYRGVTTFTIDPEDAKDFDDALSIQKLENGNWEVGVHIADVTHYVKPRTVIEKEAKERATSVYLVDRVVPMLPERLSNFICSLRPNEEKLCFSVAFELNDNAELVNSWIGRTVILSDRRFTYQEAQDILETGSGDFATEIKTLDRLAKKIREERFAKGAIGFERVEVKFKVDDQGKPLSVFFKESQDTNKLIEEFMLLANKRVAEFIGRKEVNPGKSTSAKTFVYRIHDCPNPDKYESFMKFIKKFGYDLRTSGSLSVSSSLNKLLTEVEGKKEQNIIETLAVRTMAKAVYSTQNIGHYGLAFKHYSHFTSPIRRYPDMMVHRLLDKYLQGGRSGDKEKYEEWCKHSSEMEQRASDAERASIKYKQVEFLKDKIGETFSGVISGVTEWGFYVEIDENKCEGMVPMRDLEDDYYQFDEENYCIVGKQFNKKYQLGDQVKIVIANANLEKKQLDFSIVE